MMKIAYFDMFSGVSGDMILGALVDCGVPPELLRETVAILGLKGVKIEVWRSEAHGIAAARVKVESHEHHPHRSLSSIQEMIGRSTLAGEVKETALKIFQRLGEAEATVHGVDLEKIHFHEVGAADSIADIVGAAAGFHFLEIKKYYASAFRVGTGFVEFSHGRLPEPVPATVKLIEGCPVEKTSVEAELTTPTGAAIVSTLVKKEDFVPERDLTFITVGYGQGSRTLQDRPNLLRLFIGEQDTTGELCPTTVVMECNIDDMNPEFFEYLMDQLFQAGAYDVFFTPVQMKKNRPGIMLRILTDEEKLQSMARIVLTESTTIGIRYHKVSRITLVRKTVEVDTPWGKFQVKIVALPDGTCRMKPEYESLREAARKSGVPLLEIAARLDSFLEKNPPR